MIRTHVPKPQANEQTPARPRKHARDARRSGPEDACERKAAAWQGQTTALPPLVEQVLEAPGEALDPDARAFMEARLGHDFGDVCIHADARAAASARAVNAHAYVVGRDVVFGDGLYAPSTTAGRRALAHELTHVVQQRRAKAGTTDAGYPTVGPRDDLLERQADHVAGATTHDAAVCLPWTPLAVPAPTLQRGVFEWIDDLFGGSRFSSEELRTYLDRLRKQNAPLGGLAGDNKARALVRAWKGDKSTFALDARLKVLLIEEMLAGFTGDNDERAIIDLLEGSDDAELGQIFGPGNIDASALNDDFHGEELDSLRAFYERRFPDGLRSSGRRETAKAPRGTTGGAVQDAPDPSRQDYVFLMGRDAKGASNQFYTAAELFYRARLPGAVFIKDRPTLSELLDYIAYEVKDPVGSIYIVSHANEDGTLSFALEPGDTDRKLTVGELRDALHPESGVSSLAKVGGKVDARTRIRIKGCDIGRTREMVELLDEAFGGLGTVTAPTHEQEYGTDIELREEAEKRVRAEVEKAHPEPAAIDPTLKGKEKQKALKARKAELAKRKEAIDAAIAARADEIAKAGVYEAFSGPMFQRPGTQLYAAEELGPEIKRLYGHLSEAQRKDLAKRLTQPDRRSEAEAIRDGVRHQQGQRVHRRTPHVFTFSEPQSLDEAIALFGKGYEKSFKPESFKALPPSKSNEGTTLEFEVKGHVKPPRKAAYEYAYTHTSGPIPDDAQLFTIGREEIPNPDRYAWRIERTHNRKGRTTLTVVAERVVAYLHHASLDVSPRKHFTRPESDKDFFTTSTFAPPAAGAPGGGKK